MSTGSTQPFRPSGTVSAAASTTPTNIALNGGGTAALVYNATPATAFFRLAGANGAAASTADTPVPPGARMLVSAGPFVTHATVVLSTGTGTVYFSLGDGDTY